MSFSLLVASALALGLFLLRRYYASPSPLDNIHGPPPLSFFQGNWLQISNRQNVHFWTHLAETYGPVSKLNGPFGMRILHVFDPKAMHAILVKDVDNYPKSNTPSDEFHLLLGPGLLTTQGDQHRRQRKMLNPAFSVAHLRDMTHIFYNIAHALHAAVRDRVGNEPTTVDVNGWMARTTLEMLGQAGLGHSFDNFVENSTDAYGESLKNFFPVFARVSLVGMVISKLSYFLSEPNLFRLLRAYPLSTLQYLLDISQTMGSRSKEIVDEKKIALNKGNEELIHQIGEGKDIMSILLKANTAASEEERLTDQELVAQMSIFILAGMDTTSNALSRILHVLAQHPKAQDKLRAELIEEQGCPGHQVSIPYDDIVKLPYLDAVCRETLRLFAPVNFITRRVLKDAMLPLADPIRAKDGEIMTEVAVPSGTLVVINLQLSNCNKALWGDDAYEWRPERWMEPLPGVLEEARIPGVYSNLMSFSGGHRSCIGFKFSQLEMKVVLATLLSSYSFELTDKPITWNWGPVTYPTMGEESVKPEMLLKVKAL